MARSACCGDGASGGTFSCGSLETCSVNSLYDVTIPDIEPGDTLIWTGSNFVPSGNTGDGVCFHIEGGLGIEVTGIGSASNPLIVTNTSQGEDGGPVAEARWDGTQPQPVNGVSVAHDENGVLLFPMWAAPSVFFADTVPSFDGVVQGDRWVNMNAGQVYLWDIDSDEWFPAESFTSGTGGSNKVQYDWNVEGTAGTANQFNVRRALDDITITSMEFYHPTVDPAGGVQTSAGTALIEFVVDNVVEETITWNLANDHYSHVSTTPLVSAGSEFFFRIAGVSGIPNGERWVWPTMVLVGTT